MTRASARVRANRRNAARSTGPISPEGKAIASRNALIHRLSTLGLPDEEQNFVDLAASELAGATQPSDADLNLARALIDMRRIARVRSQLITRLSEDDSGIASNCAQLARLQRYERRAEAALRKAAKFFDQHQHTSPTLDHGKGVG